MPDPETDHCTPDEFAARFELRLQTADQPEAGSGAPQLAAAGNLRNDEVWHWVLLVLLGTLLVESLLANRTAA